MMRWGKSRTLASAMSGLLLTAVPGTVFTSVTLTTPTLALGWICDPATPDEDEEEFGTVFSSGEVCYEYWGAPAFAGGWTDVGIDIEDENWEVEYFDDSGSYDFGDSFGIVYEWLLRDTGTPNTCITVWAEFHANTSPRPYPQAYVGISQDHACSSP